MGSSLEHEVEERTLAQVEPFDYNLTAGRWSWPQRRC